MKSHCFSITIRILVLPLFAVSARAGLIFGQAHQHHGGGHAAVLVPKQSAEEPALA